MVYLTRRMTSSFTGDGLDELLHILETGSEMALKRMAFLNRNCKTLASPHLSVSQATKLMTILVDGCVSQVSSDESGYSSKCLHFSASSIDSSLFNPALPALSANPQPTLLFRSTTGCEREGVMWRAHAEKDDVGMSGIG